LLGQLLGVNEGLPKGVKSLEQGSGKAARGTQTRTGWDVRHAREFKIRHLHLRQPQGFADERVLDLVDGLYSLHLRVLDNQFLHESLVKGDIDVLINCGGNDKTAMVAVIGRQVSSTAAQ
jgi:hypothetical protein